MSETVSKNVVEGRVEELRQAMLANDGDALDDLFASGMTWGHSNAHVETRAECLRNLKEKVFCFPTLEFSELDYVHSEGVLVVRHRMEATTRHQAESPGSVDISVILVWINADGCWKLLARQACKRSQ